MLTLDVQYLQDLPRLAWLAVLSKGSDRVRVYAGQGVECDETSVVEGVWETSFAEKKFDVSSVFFGSGLVLRGGKVVCCASSGLVDRLYVAQNNVSGVCCVSNSLVVLLGHVGASLDVQHDYHRESHAVLKGLDAYTRDFHVCGYSEGSFFQVYAENAVWENGVFRYEARDTPASFGSYEEYVGFLQSTVQALAANACDAKRAHRMGFYSTVSSGYDSSAVTALVRNLPGLKVYTCAQPNTPLPHWLGACFSDDGTPVAEALGLKVHPLKPAKCVGVEEEMWFLAGNCADHETIFHTLARAVFENGDTGVLFSGYHGDKIWDKHVPEQYVSRAFLRGDASGLALGEVRLWAGFVHVPLPCVGAREIAQVKALGNSPQMQAWSVGGAYDRPVPRRICEEAGVPRNVFGLRKKAVARYASMPYNRCLKASVLRSIAEHHTCSVGVLRGVMWGNKAVFRMRRLAVMLRARERMRALRVATPRAYWMPHVDFQNHVYVWAVNRLAHKQQQQWKGLSR